MAANGARRDAQRGPGRQGDERLTTLLRAVINKQASEDAVKEAAAKVEEYVAKDEKAKHELARIVTTVVNSGKLSNYGTEPAQKILRDWAKQYAVPSESNADGGSR
jgi:hypothetical protein